MLTVTKLKGNKGAKPYSLPLKLKVCAIGTSQKYVTDGEKKEYTVVGLADTTDAIKGMVYDSSKLNNMQASATIILMNYIFKNENEGTVVITKTTKVLKTAQMDVPEHLIEKGAAIANPPPAATLALRDVKRSPVKTLVSVKGRIISEDMAKTVKVRGQDVTVKTVSLKDNTDTIKVSLWRDLAEPSFVGKFLQMTNVVVTAFNDEISISSTSKTDLKECDVPMTVVKGSAIGFEMKELTVSILLCNGDEFQELEAPVQMIADTLSCQLEDIEENLQNRIPMKCVFKIKDTTIHIIDQMEKED